MARGSFRTIRLVSVKVISHSHLSRALVVALMLASWLVLTNHCALATLLAPAPAAENAASCCHRDPAPAPADDSCAQGLQCCKAARATLAGKVTVLEHPPFFQLLSWLLIDHLTLPEPVAEGLVLLEHGPPRALSFAERVLQRCLTSHAPPLAA